MQPENKSITGNGRGELFAIQKKKKQTKEYWLNGLADTCHNNELLSGLTWSTLFLNFKR